jgi:hypothetical protein
VVDLIVCVPITTVLPDTAGLVRDRTGLIVSWTTVWVAVSSTSAYSAPARSLTSFCQMMAPVWVLTAVSLPPQSGT